MIDVLCTSWLPRDARSGVLTYMRKLRDYFQDDPQIRLTFLLVDDAPRPWRILAAIVRRLIRSLAFIDPCFIEWSFEVRYRLLIRGALGRYRHTSFDLINAQDVLSGHTAKRFFGNKVPLVLTCHFNNDPVQEDMLRYGLKPHSKRSLTNRYKRRFREVDEFIFVAGFTIRTAAFLLPPDARTTVIYNGLDFPVLQPGRGKDMPDVCTAGDPGCPMLRILNTGFVDERKNQKLFIPIAKELLRRNFRDFRITLVGLGPELETLRATVDKEGLGDFIHFAGWSDDIPAFLRQTDLYIHTSLLDTCPYSVVEAVAAGVPALAFHVGGLPEMLPGDTLFAPNDHISMVDYLLDHVESLPAIGARQYEHAKQDFSRTVQVGRLRAIYTSYQPNS
jgi:glycosyltransferase involved in cell wall biosynthesis